MKRTKELSISAILTALSFLITYSPLKLVFPFFTLTLGAHVPTMLAMFISPWVSFMTVIGSCIGFMLTIPAPNSIIVVIRAATHLIFVFVGIKMLQNAKCGILPIVIVTSILHAFFEGVAVYILTPYILPDSSSAALSCGGIAALGTLIHHYIDAAIATPILIALMRAKIVKKREKITNA